MNKTTPTLAAGLAAMVLAGCSSSGANPKSPQTVANIATSVLQMNVGTANLAGTLGTNVAVTYRQNTGQTNPGASAVLVSSPTLTLPKPITLPAGEADSFGSTIASGPAASEVGTTSLTSTSQAPNATATTTFGNDGGAFGLGLEPFNYVAPLGQAGVTGAPANVIPYGVPLFDSLGGSPAVGGSNPDAFIPGGGPPAFSLAGNAAAVQAGFNAVSLGLDVFALPPAVGTYSLAVAVPANTGAVTATASAALTNLTPLPLFTSPTAVLTATGGVTLTYALPAGVSEAYIQVTDFGPTTVEGTALGTSCVGASLDTPVYYTVAVTASGTSTLPSGSICLAADNTTASSAPSDGDAFTVQGIGFDYPAYEASYPSSLGKPAPSLIGTGASHQSDITISAANVYNVPTTAAVLVPGGFPVAPASFARHKGTAIKRK